MEVSDETLAAVLDALGEGISGHDQAGPHEKAITAEAMRITRAVNPLVMGSDQSHHIRFADSRLKPGAS